jgi:hypothetical protein
MIRRRTLVPLVLLAVGVPLWADVTFNLVNDFSATSNPNGVVVWRKVRPTALSRLTPSTIATPRRRPWIIGSTNRSPVYSRTITHWFGTTCPGRPSTMDMASSFLQICSAWTLHRQFPGLTELSKRGHRDLERRIDLRRLGPLAVGDIHGNGMLPFSGGS